MNQSDQKELDLNELEQVAGGTSARLPGPLSKDITDLINESLRSSAGIVGPIEELAASIKKLVKEIHGVELSDENVLSYIKNHTGHA